MPSRKIKSQCNKAQSQKTKEQKLNFKLHHGIEEEKEQTKKLQFFGKYP